MKKIIILLGIFSLIFVFNVKEIKAVGYETCRDLCGVVYGKGTDANVCNSACAEAYSNCKLGDYCKTSSEEDGVCRIGEDGFMRACFVGELDTGVKKEELGTSNNSTSGGFFSGISSGYDDFGNPLQFDSLEGFLMAFLVFLKGIIVILSLVFIVIGALIYVTSSGNAEKVSKAKLIITSSLIGLSFGIAAPTFIKETSLILGLEVINNSEVASALSIAQVLTKILTFLLSIMGVLAITAMIVGSIMYLISAGNEDRIDMGKKIVKNAIIGVIVAFSSLILIRQIAQFFIG